MKKSKFLTLSVSLLFAFSAGNAWADANETFLLDPEAKAAAEEIIQLAKQDQGAKLMKWMEFLENKKFKKQRKDEKVLTAWGNMFLEAGLYPEAEEMGRLAYEAKGDYLPAIMLHGNALFELKKLGDAAAKFEEAIAAHPDEKQAYLKTADVYKYINPEHALQVTSQYKEKFPNDPDINKTIGNIYYHENKIKEALEAYDVYFKEVGDKADLEAQEQYAIMLYAKKDYDKSLELVEKILPKSPEAISLNRLKFYNLMELMQVQGAKAASDTFFGKKYADSLYNATDYKYQGQLAEMMMDTAMMLTAFEKAAKLDPEKPEILIGLSEAYEKVGNADKAVEIYKKYIEKNAKTKGDKLNGLIKEGKIYYGAAAEIQDSAKFDVRNRYVAEGDKIFAEVSKEAPESFYGPFWRARIQTILDPNNPIDAIKEQYDEAYKRMEGKDESYNNERKECLVYTAFYYFQKDDHAKAIEYSDKVLALDPNNKLAQNIKNAVAQMKK